jgi:pimeloyl-ACP methyl ester carboxylesterase/tetratricopeptide (TPR) repeat protein
MSLLRTVAAMAVLVGPLPPAAARDASRPSVPAASAPAAQSPAPTPRLADVRLPTGVRLRYAEAGDPAAPPVILLHGYTDSWHSWSRVVPPLAARHRVYALDQRGHGDSDRPATGYAMRDFAADVVAFMDARAIPRAAIVGHSMGSIVAREVARIAPTRVSRLVLVGGSAGVRNPVVLALRKDVDALVDPVPTAFAREFQVSTTHRPVPPAFMDRAVSESLKLPAAVWRQVIAGIVDAPAAQPIGARVPTLLLWGDRDAVFPRHEQDVLLRAFRPATLTVYAGTGHALHWEEPDRFARDVLAFLDATPAPARSARASGGPSPEDAPVAATASAAAPPADSVPLHAGLGDWRHPITTRVPRAQRYFDQGLALTYGFNHGEAIRAFREAQRLDPSCAMCAWGEALAFGPNINASMDSASAAGAWAAITRARSLAPRATPAERAYIDALGARYAAAFTPPGTPARKALDSAYARAMERVAARFPRDDDARVLYAESLMLLSPWDYWRAGRTPGAFVPKPTTRPMLAALEAVIARNPRHAGACHYFIHAVEAAQPERAVPCAERLPTLMPGAGHIVHMPAHVYVRVGRYADAIDRNVHAVHADEAHLADLAPDGAYRLAYYPHNYHFLWFAATMAGRRDQAIDAARQTAAKTNVDLLRAPGMGALQHYLVTPLYALVRFEDWAGVLREPAPPADLPYPTGVWHYARALAFAATGRTAEAEDALARLVAARADGALASVAIWDLNRADALLDVAIAAVRGDLAARRGDHAGAIAALRRGVALEDALTYDEPPTWHLPVRHQLGDVLLAAGRPAEAERTFREDLRRHAENGWALRGLQRALVAQGRQVEARAVAARLQKAWGATRIGQRPTTHDTHH